MHMSTQHKTSDGKRKPKGKRKPRMLQQRKAALQNFKKYLEALRIANELRARRGQEPLTLSDIINH